MNRIAIIDTVINPEGLHCRTFEYYNMCGVENTILHKPQISHGTMVAQVLDSSIEEYDLINIQVLVENDYIQGKAIGKIRTLEEALKLCLNLNINIVSLSAVSTILSDSNYLYYITKELTQKSVVVSALANKGYVTIPTSYPFVVGVQADQENILSPGEIARVKGDIRGVNLCANCMLDIVRQNHYTPSNSLAVPLVTAYINGKMEKGISLEKAMYDLPEYACKFKKKIVLEDVREVPIILMFSIEISKAIKICQMVMNSLFSSHQIQTSGLCCLSVKEDIRFKIIENMSNIEDSILFMEKYYKTDIIFVIVKWEDRFINSVKFDIKVAIEEVGARVFFENQCKWESIETIADSIYCILR